jgi:hypothetical protein
MSVMTLVYVGLPGGTDSACDPGTPCQTRTMPMEPVRPDWPDRSGDGIERSLPLIRGHADTERNIENLPGQPAGGVHEP